VVNVYTVSSAPTQFLTFLMSFNVHALKVTEVGRLNSLHLMDRVHETVDAINALQSTGKAEKIKSRHKAVLTRITSQALLN